MTNKDIKKIEKAMEKVVRQVLEIEYYNNNDDEATIPMRLIEEMEDYMGESITFMGIS